MAMGMHRSRDTHTAREGLGIPTCRIHTTVPVDLPVYTVLEYCPCTGGLDGLGLWATIDDAGRDDGTQLLVGREYDADRAVGHGGDRTAGRHGPRRGWRARGGRRGAVSRRCRACIVRKGRPGETDTCTRSRSCESSTCSVPGWVWRRR